MYNTDVSSMNIRLETQAVASLAAVVVAKDL